MPELFEQEAVKMETDVAVVPDTNPMIMAAIDGKLDAESIKMLIELSNKQEDRRAKQEFDSNFSAMQSELPSIAKSAKGYDYKYARIEDLQRACNPIISKYGFSYSWREETIPTGKRTILAIHGHGYTRENFFDAPELTGTKQMNPIQVAGAMSTYGRRYTFIAGLGLTVEGEDSDAFISDDAGSLTIDLREYINSGKLTPEAVKVIEGELSKEQPDLDKLKVYWKKAKAKVEK